MDRYIWLMYAHPIPLKTIILRIILDAIEMELDMCLAVPGLVETVDGRTAIIDFGGVKREVVIDLMEPGSIKPGVYVLVHTGFVIQILEKKEALETLEVWREILSHVDKPYEEI